MTLKIREGDEEQWKIIFNTINDKYQMHILSRQKIIQQDLTLFNPLILV